MNLRRITLKTDDLERQADFYANVLGLKTRLTDEHLVVTAGASEIVFEENNAGAYYHFAFNIPSGQINEALKWAEERVTVLPYRGNKIVDFSAWSAKAIYFLDPAGNVLELIARKPAIIPDDEFFSSKSLKSISEIGLATNNVKFHFDRLNAQHRVPFFSGNTTDFCAAGNHNGLFIIVRSDAKKWMPTTVPAKSFPVNVVFDQDGEERVYEFYG